MKIVSRPEPKICKRAAAWDLFCKFKFRWGWEGVGGGSVCGVLVDFGHQFAALGCVCGLGACAFGDG